MRSYDDIHDEWLVLRCQDGDEEALGELVERWQPRLVRQAFRLTGDHEGARDVVQQTWLAIVGGIHRLKDAACFRRWAYQIITFKSADWIRRRQRDRGRPYQDSDGASAAPTNEYSENDDIAVLRSAMKRLSPDRRNVLTMFYLDEMSLEEIAHAISLPVGTIKSRLHYARLELKQTLERGMP